MKSLALAAISMLALMEASPSYVLFPNALQIQAEDGRPIVSVRESADRIDAKIRFGTSWQQSIDVLKSRYGDGYYDLDVVRIHVLPLNVDFISSFWTDDNPALLESDAIFTQDALEIRFSFNKDYTVAQIREALLFPISMGTVNAKVTCLGSVALDVCDKIIPRIPLINHFAKGANPELQLERAHYTYLQTYASNLVVTRYRYMSVEFAEEVKERYWMSGRCSEVIATWDREACMVTQAYSLQGSIREAVVALGNAIYPPEVAENFDYFVLLSETMKVRRLNLDMDFERIRHEMNENMAILIESDYVQIDDLNTGKVRASSRLTFQLPAHSMFWNERRIWMRVNKYLKGETDLFLNVLGRVWQVPVGYDVALGFSYDPIDQTADLQDIWIESLEFLDRNGPGYAVLHNHRDKVEYAVNSLLGHPDQRSEIESYIEAFLLYLQDAEIGFEPIVGP